MSKRSERQSARTKAILRELQTAGSVTIHDLCARHQASLATIRRDLEHLESEGLLRRTHGGAVSIEPLFYEPFRHDASFNDLVGSHAAEKRRIAQAAAELVGAGDTISLTAGTTTTEIARCLRPLGGIQVVTNTVNVAMELAKRKDIQVFVTGGHLRGDWFSLVGQGAIDSLRQAFVDIVFIGANGIHPVAGLTCHSPEEAAVNRAMITQAKRRIAVVDRSKFNVIAGWQICPLEACERIITDRGADEFTILQYLEQGINVTRV